MRSSCPVSEFSLSQLQLTLMVILAASFVWSRNALWSASVLQKFFSRCNLKSISPIGSGFVLPFRNLEELEASAMLALELIQGTIK